MSGYRATFGHFNWHPKTSADYWEFAPPDTGWYTVGCEAGGTAGSGNAEYIIENGFAAIPTDCDFACNADGPDFISGCTGLASGSNAGAASANFRLRVYDATNSVQIAYSNYALRPGDWAIIPHANLGAEYTWPAADARLQIQVAVIAALKKYDGTDAPYKYGKIRLYSMNVQAIR